MSSRYTAYYLRQLNQTGGRYKNFDETYSQPSLVQRGYGFGGIGGLFSTLIRHLTPLVASGFNALKNQGIISGQNILSELNNSPSKSFKDIVRNESKSAIDNLSNKAINKLKRKSSTKPEPSLPQPPEMTGTGFFGSPFVHRTRKIPGGGGGAIRKCRKKRCRKGKKSIKTGGVKKRRGHSAKTRRRKTLAQLGTGRRRKGKRKSKKNQRELDIFN